jgi:hypothetical protein
MTIFLYFPRPVMCLEILKWGIFLNERREWSFFDYSEQPDEQMNVGIYIGLCHLTFKE